ncbi:site-specific integrase [soil metagenome]
MASITKRDNGKWRARYRDAAGKEHARHFERKVDGQRWLDQVTASVVRGDYVDPKAGTVTLRAYATSWEAVQVSSDGTARIVDNALRLHVLPELGDYPIKAIRPTMVQALVKKLEDKELSPGTVRGIYHVVTQVFTAAVHDKVISSSPCQRITLPKDNSGEVVPPNVEQVAAFRDAFDERWRALVVTLAGTGVRVGELLGLEVSDVDFLRRTVKVDRQRVQTGQTAPLKSRRARRTIPVGQVVIDTLAAHLAAYPSDGPLFVNEVGEPLLYRRWRTLAEAAARKAKTPDLTAHSCRHFYASVLIAGGASVKQVQERLGHASPMITLETYAHLWPGEDDRTRDLMDVALSPLADSPRTREA